MGSDIIATGVSDPDFYARQASRLGGAIASITTNWRARQEEKAQRDQEEIDRAFRMMTQMPEVADTWGQALVAKYGAKYPEVPAMVSAIQNRHTLAREIPEAGSAWESAVERRRTEHAAALKAASSQPDFIENPDPGAIFAPGPGGMFINPSLAIVPNQGKQKELERLNQVDPAYFTGQALDDLPVHQANAALLYAKERGIPIQRPTPFDPNRDLPPTERGLVAVEKGLIPRGTPPAQALRIGAKLDPSPAALQQQDFRRDEREARQIEAERMLGVRDSKLRERMELGERIAMAREDRHMANQKSLVDYRASRRVGRQGGGDGSDLSHKDIVAGSKSAAADYEAKKKDALQGITGKDRQEALKKFQAEHGKKPHVITPYTAKQLKEIAESDEEAVELAEELSQAVADGHSEASVLRVFRATHEVMAKSGAPKQGTPVVGRAATPVKKPAPPPGMADEARAALKRRFPGKKPAEIEALVKEFLRDHS